MLESGVTVPSSRILLRPGGLDRSRCFCCDLLGLSIYREFGRRPIPGWCFPRPGLLKVSWPWGLTEMQIEDPVAPG